MVTGARVSCILSHGPLETSETAKKNDATDGHCSHTALGMRPPGIVTAHFSPPTRGYRTVMHTEPPAGSHTFQVP